MGKMAGRIAVLAVIVQGVLGGLRVTEHNQFSDCFTDVSRKFFSAWWRRSLL